MRELQLPFISEKLLLVVLFNKLILAFIFRSIDLNISLNYLQIVFPCSEIEKKIKYQFYTHKNNFMRADVMDSITSPESLLKSIVNIGHNWQLLFLLFKSQIITFEKEKLQFYFKISGLL